MVFKHIYFIKHLHWSQNKLFLTFICKSIIKMELSFRIVFIKNASTIKNSNSYIIIITFPLLIKADYDYVYSIHMFINISHWSKRVELQQLIKICWLSYSIHIDTQSSSMNRSEQKKYILFAIKHSTKINSSNEIKYSSHSFKKNYSTL